MKNHFSRNGDTAGPKIFEVEHRTFNIEHRHVTFAEIAKQNFIFYKKASYTFRIIDEYFRDEQIMVKPIIELASMDAIKELVKLGVGISIVAPWIARRELEEK